MIQFIKNVTGLKENESYMISTLVIPSPLIKVNDLDITDNKWKSITDKMFFDRFCKDLADQNICIFKDNIE